MNLANKDVGEGCAYTAKIATAKSQSGRCHQYSKNGTCSKAQCPFIHDVETKGKSKGKSKKGKSKGKDKDKGDKGKNDTGKS